MAKTTVRKTGDCHFHDVHDKKRSQGLLTDNAMVYLQYLGLKSVDRTSATYPRIKKKIILVITILLIMRTSTDHLNFI